MALIDTASQDSKGLLVTGRFHSTAEAQACRTVVKERMAAGKAVKCSIGYMTEDESYEKIEGRSVRRIKKLSVYEASFVNLPANPAAEVNDVKSHDPVSNPEGDDMATADKGSVLDALKELLGLVTKGDKPMSKSSHTRLKAFAEAMDEHGAATKEHAKDMTEHGKAACAMGKEMKAFLKDFAAENDDAGPDSEDDPNEREVEVTKPKKKPDKEDDSDEEKTKKAYRAQLRARSAAGRRMTSCP
jgi:hypothetical protein